MDKNVEGLWKRLMTIFGDTRALVSACAEIQSAYVDSESKTLNRRVLGSLGDLTYVVVNGNEIGVKRSMDFVEGGNGYRYDWIPKKEVWLDCWYHPSQWPYLAVHEAHEVGLMAGGMGYEAAHERANGVEKHYRARGLWV